MTAIAVLYALVSVLNITLGNFIGDGLSVEGSKVVTGLGLSCRSLSSSATPSARSH